MANTIRLKRRTLASGTGVPGSLAQGEVAYSEHDQKLHIGIESAGIHVIAGSGQHVTWPGTGIITQTAAASGATPPTVAARTMTGTANVLTVTNGDGISGNPTFDIADNPILSGTSGMILPEGTTAQRPGAPGTSNYFRYNTTDDIVEWWDGSAWVRPDTGGGTPDQNVYVTVIGDSGTTTASSTTDTVDIAGGTNITTAATADTLTVNLDVTGGIAMGTAKITGLGTPTAGTDAVTKDYADSVAGGFDYKESVQLAETGTNLDLTGEETIDGTLTSTSRVLVTAQTASAENGIYITGAGAWTRATDADTSAEVTAGMSVFVSEGTDNSDTVWTLTTNDTIVLDTTALTFTQTSGLGQISAGNGLTKTGNTIDAVGTASRISVAANSIDIDAAYVGQTSITTLGTITTGSWTGTAIAPTSGGTGLSTYTTGDIVYASASNVLSKLAVGATDTFLQISGGVPTWSTTMDGGTF